MKDNRRILIIIQIIIILLSIVEVSGILPRTGMAGMYAACAGWALLMLKNNN